MGISHTGPEVFSYSQPDGLLSAFQVAINQCALPVDLGSQCHDYVALRQSSASRESAARCTFVAQPFLHQSPGGLKST